MELLHFHASSDQVHLSLAFRGDTSALSSCYLFYQSKGFQRMQRVADDATSRTGVVLRRHLSLLVGSAAKHSAHGPNAQSLSEVHTASHSCCANVIPIGIQRVEFLEASSLGVVHIGRQLNLQKRDNWRQERSTKDAATRE